MFGRPPKMLIPRFGQRKWNCARGSSSLGRRRPQRAVLGREAPVGREHVRLGRDVDELAEAGVRDLAVVALEEVLAHDLPVRVDLRLPARVVDERVDVEPELGDLRRAASRARRRAAPASAPALAKTNGPHVSTATGTRPSSSCGKSGSSSLRGAARRRPSSPYVQAWYGHCSVSRAALALDEMEPRWRQTLTKPRSDAVAVARDDDGRRGRASAAK